MLREVVVGFRRAHSPATHAASYDDHEKIVAWFSISIHACASLPIVMVLRLVARTLRTAGALLQITNAFKSTLILDLIEKFRKA